MSTQRAIIVTSLAADGDRHRYFINWMADRIGLDGVFKVEDAIAIAHVQYDEDLDAEVLGVVAINNWSPAACEGHIASDGSARWMTRQFARTVYRFVFDHAQKSRFNFCVGVDNTAAVRMHDKLGHERMCRLADAYGDGEDAYLYGLTKKQWLAGKFAETKEGK
jgi:RimJ/RimL family protein N-acetyltransferase